MLPVVDIDQSYSLIKQNKIRMVSSPKSNKVLDWISSFRNNLSNDEEVVTVFVFGSAEELNRVVTKLMLSSPLYSTEKLKEIKSLLLNKFLHYFSSVSLDVCINKINEDVHISFSTRHQDTEQSAEASLRFRLCFESHRTEFFVLAQKDSSWSNPIHPLYKTPYRRVFPAQHRINIPPEQALVMSLPSQALNSIVDSELLFLFATEGSRSCWEPSPGFLLNLKPILELETSPEEFEAHRSDLSGLNDLSCLSEQLNQDLFSNKKISVLIIFILIMFVSFAWIRRRLRKYRNEIPIKVQEIEESEIMIKKQHSQSEENKRTIKKFLEFYEEHKMTENKELRKFFYAIDGADLRTKFKCENSRSFSKSHLEVPNKVKEPTGLRPRSHSGTDYLVELIILLIL
eukprot:GHVP01024193.1.p1 GENE.GHVP01024193.1~~GHVP01024193.1.p1  ORF type:complete len:400 (+),score=64.34 GHVP01024193.1:126-1325(+)